MCSSFAAAWVQGLRWLSLGLMEDRMRRFNLWSTVDDIIGLVLVFGIVYVVLSL